MRRTLALVLATAFVAAGACASREEPLRIGAVYPLSGTQGPGGIDEFRGVRVAVELVNSDGGIDGRPVELVPVDVPAGEAAPAAIERLDETGVRFVLGSYGSTISAPAADAAASRGLLFWETGAVGEMSGEGAGRLVFRVAPSGAVLGRNAMAFIADEYGPAMGIDASELRYAVTLVDDAYGRAVAQGALDELSVRDYTLASEIAYDPRDVDMSTLVRELAASEPDVLFVSAYLDDAVALRRAMVRNDVDLLASIGTSSSYCMPEFGAALGAEAIGLFASDKPSGAAIEPSTLRPDGAALLERARAAYDDRWHEEMSPAALAGFSAAWALFAEVMPKAVDTTPRAIADAALAADLPMGSLPNGSGLSFGEPGTATAGDNIAAASVIWEWMIPGEHMIVWPPELATHEVRALDIAP